MAMWPRLALLILVLPGLASPADSQSFTVSADVVPGCLVSGSTETTGLDFGTLAFGTHPATTAGPLQAMATTGSGGTLELECTAGLTLTVSVDAGQHGDVSSRHLMAPGGTPVPYALYVDADHTTPLPPGGSVDVAVPPSGVMALPIHAVAYLPGSQQAPGLYTDTLGVTLSW
jgi:spore coat protein U-like protein